MSMIVNPQRARQLIDFTGMKYGSIYPTDIDGVIEYKNLAYLYYEIKYGGKDVPFGQKLALERLVKDTYKSGKKSIAIIGEHNIDDTEENVILANCNVREVYLFNKNAWLTPNTKITVRELTDIFINELT